MGADGKDEREGDVEEEEDRRDVEGRVEEDPEAVGIGQHPLDVARGPDPAGIAHLADGRLLLRRQVHPEPLDGQQQLIERREPLVDNGAVERLRDLFDDPCVRPALERLDHPLGLAAVAEHFAQVPRTQLVDDLVGNAPLGERG
jgi:hypothetical protein